MVVLFCGFSSLFIFFYDSSISSFTIFIIFVSAFFVMSFWISYFPIIYYLKSCDYYLDIHSHVVHYHIPNTMPLLMNFISVIMDYTISIVLNSTHALLILVMLQVFMILLYSCSILGKFYPKSIPISKFWVHWNNSLIHFHWLFIFSIPVLGLGVMPSGCLTCYPWFSSPIFPSTFSIIFVVFFSSTQNHGFITPISSSNSFIFVTCFPHSLT